MAAVGLTLLVWPGCRAAEPDTATVGDESQGPPAGVVARLDSGTLAYRAADYERARRYYREAAELAPESAAAWFGVYLAESALGNEAAADSARARAGELGNAADMHVTPHGAPPDSTPGGDSARAMSRT